MPVHLEIIEGLVNIYGKFNTDYKIYADFDWLLRAVAKFEQKMNYIGIPIAYYLKGGESEGHNGKYIYERVAIIQKTADYRELFIFAISYPTSFCRHLLTMLRNKRMLIKLREIEMKNSVPHMKSKFVEENEP